MKCLNILTVAAFLTSSTYVLGANEHGNNEGLTSSEWNPKSGLDFCSGQGLRRLLSLVQKQPPSNYKNSDLVVSDWQEISKIKDSWAKAIPGDKFFDSKVKSIFVYPQKNANDSLMRPAKVALEYFNGSKEEITIDPPLFLSRNCSQYIYESEKDVPKGSVYTNVDGFFVVSSDEAFAQRNREMTSSVVASSGDRCECLYTPLNFPSVNVSVICGAKGSNCECSVNSAPAIHQATYLYVMSAKCGGKDSKSVPLIGELGLSVPSPYRKVVKK